MHIYSFYDVAANAAYHTNAGCKKSCMVSGSYRVSILLYEYSNVNLNRSRKTLLFTFRMLEVVRINLLPDSVAGQMMMMFDFVVIFRTFAWKKLARESFWISVCLKEMCQYDFSQHLSHME